MIRKPKQQKVWGPTEAGGRLQYLEIERSGVAHSGNLLASLGNSGGWHSGGRDDGKGSGKPALISLGKHGKEMSKERGRECWKFLGRSENRNERKIQVHTVHLDHSIH